MSDSDLDRLRAVLPKYDIDGEIGRGGWGVVLLGTHRDLGRPVAIKQLPTAMSGDPTAVARFRSEARLVASLDHPHIVPVYDFVDDAGLCVLVMEYLAAGTLWQRFTDQGLAIETSCALMLAAAAALQHAHSRGVLHRDIKPENFLFNASGTMKLGDFGIAKLVNQGQTGFTLAGQVVGTPAYMAPEQATGGELSPATDVYSCGAMLYELLTGELPFPETAEVLSQLFQRVSRNPTPIAEIRPDLPYVLGEVVMRALQRDPADRYPSAEAFGVALAHAASRAFGAGWLVRSGVPVLGASALVAAAEQPSEATVVVPTTTARQHPTTTHARLGDVLGGTPAPTPAPVPTPAPAAPVAAPRRRVLPWVAAAVTVLLVTTGATVAALRSRDTGTAAESASTPAPVSTPVSTTAPTPVVTAPTVVAVQPESGGRYTVTWADAAGATAHYLDITQQDGDRTRSYRFAASASPQTVQLEATGQTCVRLASAGSGGLTWSQPSCR